MNAKQRTMAICFLAVSLVISGCGSGQLFGPTLTPTPTPTFTPTQTSTPTATPTLTPTSTPTPTPTVTPTFTPTSRPTFTNTPTATKKPQLVPTSTQTTGTSKIFYNKTNPGVFEPGSAGSSVPIGSVVLSQGGRFDFTLSIERSTNYIVGKGSGLVLQNGDSLIFIVLLEGGWEVLYLYKDSSGQGGIHLVNLEPLAFDLTIQASVSIAADGKDILISSGKAVVRTRPLAQSFFINGQEVSVRALTEPGNRLTISNLSVSAPK